MDQLRWYGQIKRLPLSLSHPTLIALFILHELTLFDYSIGQDVQPYTDSFLVYISDLMNTTLPKHLILNETLSQPTTKHNSSQVIFCTSGINQRQVDLTPYLNHKIILEFVVVDKVDQAIDVGHFTPLLITSSG